MSNRRGCRMSSLKAITVVWVNVERNQMLRPRLALVMRMRLPTSAHCRLRSRQPSRMDSPSRRTSNNQLMRPRVKLQVLPGGEELLLRQPQRGNQRPTPGRRVPNPVLTPVRVDRTTTRLSLRPGWILLQKLLLRRHQRRLKSAVLAAWWWKIS